MWASTAAATSFLAYFVEYTIEVYGKSIISSNKVGAI